MASRKLVRDLFVSLWLHSHQYSNTRLRLLPPNGYSGFRRYSVFDEFSKKLEGEAQSNLKFQKTMKEFKEKAEELKGVKEDLKARTKQTTEQLYKHVDGVWTEAEATAKKVKESFGIGKEDSSQKIDTSANQGTDANDQSKDTPGEEGAQQSGPSDTAESLFRKFKSSVSSASPKVSMAFQKLKEAKMLELAKKGYEVVKDELRGTAQKRKHMEHEASSSSTGERSTRTEVVIVPSKQSLWSKKWEAFKDKMRGHPVFKRVSGLSEPVVAKSQELAEDMRERWETSDSPVVHKIQDLNETVFGETDAALSFKEIRRRDPSFSLPEFLLEVQEIIKPVLKAYSKGDAEVLKKYCTPEVIERCKAEHQAYQSHGIFFDNKILHISDAEVRETKMMGNSPIIIVVFQTQQVYCVRDKNGAITEGGKDTIQTVYYAWAMQQVDVDELGEGALYPVWRLREMQQLGVQALI